MHYELAYRLFTTPNICTVPGSSYIKHIHVRLYMTKIDNVTHGLIPSLQEAGNAAAVTCVGSKGAM